MPLIQVPNNVNLSIEIPDGCERSVKGALYLRPGTKVITKGEWEHVQKAYPKQAKACHVVQYRPGEDYDVDKSIVGKQQAAERKKAAAEAAKAPVRSQDKPTKRQRKLAEVEAKTKGDTKPDEPKAIVPPPPPPPTEAKPKSKDKSKPK